MRYFHVERDGEPVEVDEATHERMMRGDWRGQATEIGGLFALSGEVPTLAEEAAQRAAMAPYMRQVAVEDRLREAGYRMIDKQIVERFAGWDFYEARRQMTDDYRAKRLANIEANIKSRGAYYARPAGWYLDQLGDA